MHFLACQRIILDQGLPGAQFLGYFDDQSYSRSVLFLAALLIFREPNRCLLHDLRGRLISIRAVKLLLIYVIHNS